MRRVLMLAVLMSATLAAAPAGRAGGPLHERRLGPASLVYRGSFRLPAPLSDTETFDYGGTALAFDPARRALFAVGHDWYQLDAEVSIPPLARGGRLRRARFVQRFADPTDGEIDTAGTSPAKIGGQLVFGGRLLGTVYVYYDARASQTRSHWVRPSTSLHAGRARGLYRVGAAGAGFASGFLAEVPPEWRRALGGAALTGNCCIPIISRTSFGPAAFAFDPNRLGHASRVGARPLVDYPQAHPTLGRWEASWDPADGILFGGGTAIRGVVFPRRSRSVLFFGTQGVGRFCYGEGTDRRDLDRRPSPDGGTWCYDPANASKGTHAYPYVPEVWAYDAGDLAAVARGRRRPWQVRPYATWRLRLPFDSPQIGGAAYDPARGVVYIAQQYADGAAPVIDAFSVGG